MLYPGDPIASSTSAAAIFDPMWRFAVDQGYELRRSKHSRPRRRYQLEYLGLTTTQLHVLCDFLQQRRLGVETFEWIHQTSLHTASVLNTTPVILLFPHGCVSNQWVAVFDSTPNTSLNGVWPVTRINQDGISLNGSVAGGAGTCTVTVYFPNAVARFAEDTLESAIKVRGSYQQLASNSRWSFSVLIEELF